MAIFINHDKVTEEITQATELVGQLRALLLPSLPSNPISEIAREHFEVALRLLTCTISGLRQSKLKGSTTSLLVDMVKEEKATSNGVKRKRKGEEDDRVNKKRGLQWTGETLNPYVDGHQWRKYGQKRICEEHHLRHYFRCTHLTDQGCPAKKTVQQKDCKGYQPKYIVTYFEKLTCKTTVTKPVVPPLIIDSSSPQSSSDNSSIAESKTIGLEDVVKASSSVDATVNSPISSNYGCDLSEFPWYEMDDIEWFEMDDTEMMLGMSTNYGSIWGL